MVTENLPLEFLQEYRDCVGRMRPCIVMEQNGLMGELAWLFLFDRLVKGGQGLRVTLGIHCCPVLQEVYQKGAILVKEERQHNFQHLCRWPWIFLVVVTLDALTGCFVILILVQSDNTKIHLQPPLVPGTYSLSWHSAADDQYSGKFPVTLHTVQTSLPMIMPFWSPKKALRGK